MGVKSRDGGEKEEKECVREEGRIIVVRWTGYSIRRDLGGDYGYSGKGVERVCKGWV